MDRQAAHFGKTVFSTIMDDYYFGFPGSFGLHKTQRLRAADKIGKIILGRFLSENVASSFTNVLGDHYNVMYGIIQEFSTFDDDDEYFCEYTDHQLSDLGRINLRRNCQDVPMWVISKKQFLP